VEKEFLNKEAAEEWIQGVADAHQKKVEVVFPERRTAAVGIKEYSEGLNKAAKDLKIEGMKPDPDMGKVKKLLEEIDGRVQEMKLKFGK